MRQRLVRAVMQRIVAQRAIRPYEDMLDFILRVRPDETEARALILCGALDAFSENGNRTALLWQWALAQKTASSRPQQTALFDAPIKSALPPPASEDLRERLRREFAVLGFLRDRHPISLFAESLKGIKRVTACRLHHWIGRNVILAGLLITAKTARTKQGDAMEFVTFEDETGLFETTFFPKVFDRFCHQLDHGRPYLLHGMAEENWGAVTLTVERAVMLR